jgi:hypothetical protein
MYREGYDREVLGAQALGEQAVADHQRALEVSERVRLLLVTMGAGSFGPDPGWIRVGDPNDQATAPFLRVEDILQVPIVERLETPMYTTPLQRRAPIRASGCLSSS